MGWCWGGRDGLAKRGPPPLDASTMLRVSGPSLGWIPARSGDGGGEGGGVVLGRA